jgi:hypothetical protein
MRQNNQTDLNDQKEIVPLYCVFATFVGIMGFLSFPTFFLRIPDRHFGNFKISTENSISRRTSEARQVSVYDHMSYQQRLVIMNRILDFSQSLS